MGANLALQLELIATIMKQRTDTLELPDLAFLIIRQKLFKRSYQQGNKMRHNSCCKVWSKLNSKPKKKRKKGLEGKAEL